MLVLELDLDGFVVEILGQFAASDTAQQEISEFFALFGLGVGGALGTTLDDDLGLLLRTRSVFVLGIELGVARLGLFGHGTERGSLGLRQLIPVAAGDERRCGCPSRYS